MTEAEWLAGLKVGDPVAVYGTRELEGIRRVERITPSGLVVVGGRKYRRGMCRGDGWDHYSISEPTREIRATLHRRRVLHEVSEIRWDAIPLTTIEAVLRLVREGVGRG